MVMGQSDRSRDGAPQRCLTLSTVTLSTFAGVGSAIILFYWCFVFGLDFGA